MSIWTRIRSWFCGHHFRMGKGSWRDEDGMLHSVCLKCGREYVAACGLYLPYKKLVFSFNEQDAVYKQVPGCPQIANDEIARLKGVINAQ